MERNCDISNFLLSSILLGENFHNNQVDCVRKMLQLSAQLNSPKSSIKRIKRARYLRNVQEPSPQIKHDSHVGNSIYLFTGLW